MARAKKRRPRHRFRVGDIIFEPATKKFYTVERLKTHFGMRYLMRSLESGNPGNPKIAEFLDNQLADGYLVRISKREFLRATR